jgi:hypothetical protein
MDLGSIEKMTGDYASAKRDLDDLVAEIAEKTEALKREYSPKLKLVMSRIAKRHEVLYRSIAENPELFQKPKTQIFEGIKVGFMAGKGSLSMEDEQLTVELIKEHLPKQAKILIKTVEEPNVAAIKKLPTEQMELINVEIVGKEDKVVISPVDTTVGRILNSLIKVQAEDLSEEYQEAA